MIEIDYTNHKGIRRVRHIQPEEGGLHEGSNHYHPEKQWLLFAIDLEDGRLKTWAMRNIHSWKELSDG